MPYLEISPSPALRRWVDCFWWRTGAAGEEVRPILPDGAADVIFDLSGDAYAVGTMTKALVVPNDTRELVGVRFRPGRAAAMLGIPLRDITDARVPLPDVTPSLDAANLPEKLSFETSLASRVQLVEGELLRRVARIDEPDGRVDAAVALLLKSGGRAPVDRVAAEACMTRQHLRRRFLDDVGISPKTFARVVRFQKLVEAIRKGTVTSWADAAAAHGYADQSHMIADFRDLAGTTPKKFHSSYS